MLNVKSDFGYVRPQIWQEFKLLYLTMVTFRSSFKFCLKQLTTNPQFRQREGDKTSRGSIHTATSTSGTKPHGMSHNPERKICVQYNPGPDDEAGSSNEKIREATLSKEYDLQDVPTMQALLQKVAKDFPMVQDRVNLVYDDGKYVGPEIIETDAEMTDVTIEGSGPGKVSCLSGNSSCSRHCS